MSDLRRNISDLRRRGIVLLLLGSAQIYCGYKNHTYFSNDNLPLVMKIIPKTLYLIAIFDLLRIDCYAQ